MEGWIKIHRKILEWEWYPDRDTREVFFHLLLTANHKAGRFMGHEIKAGEVVIGRKSLSKAVGISERSVRTALTHLKSTSEIAIRTTNRFSVITLLNWSKYQITDQQNDQQSDQQVTSKRPANDHKQECNNKKNDNKNIYGNKFEKLNYNNKGIMYSRINGYVKKFGEQPSQKQIDHWIDTELK